MAFEVRIDDIEQAQWMEYASQFADYSIYQTWAYQDVCAELDGHKVSRAIVQDEHNEIVAMSHVRIRRVMGFSIGYILAGPMFLRKDGACGCSVEVMKALHDAYLGPVVNVLRVVPNINDDPENQRFVDVFEANGFQRLEKIAPYRTLILPLGCSSETLRQGLHQKWRKKLRKAEKAGVEVIERSDEEPFKVLNDFYQDLRERKGFKGVEPEIFARSQSALSDSEKMSLVVAYFNGEPVTVHLTSHLGDTAVALLVAGNEKGYSCWSSYLAWWKALTTSNDKGMKQFDFGGIDIENNPNVSRFKAGMGGREKSRIGVFEGYTNFVVKGIFRKADMIYKKLKR
ncbi:lipid II:glycine glycyltransferase FemX [Planctomycetota bacterium]